jgi:hypothetical protein
MNLDYLDSMEIAYAIFNTRRKLKFGDKIRVPLSAFIKYKGFKILVSAITPPMIMSKK